MRAGTCRPTDNELLLIRCATAVGEHAADCWRQWQLEGDPGEGSPVLPLVWRNLTAQGLGDTLPGEFKEAYHGTWRHNHHLIAQAARGLGALRAAGIPTMVLKGTALSVVHYRDLGARPFVDVDVLVPTQTATDAIIALRKSGWEPLINDFEALRSINHAAPFGNRNGGVIDLHWHSLWRPAPEDDLWEAAVPIEVGGMPTLAPSSADLLLQVCAHGVQWVPSPPGRWIADCLVVLRSSGDAFDWDRVVARTGARHLAVFIHSALRLLAETFPEAAIPSWVLPALRTAGGSTLERSAHAAALRMRRGMARSLIFHCDRYRAWAAVDFDGRRRPSFPEAVLRPGGVLTPSQLPAYIRRKLSELSPRHP